MLYTAEAEAPPEALGAGAFFFFLFFLPSFILASRYLYQHPRLNPPGPLPLLSPLPHLITGVAVTRNIEMDIQIFIPEKKKKKGNI